MYVTASPYVYATHTMLPNGQGQRSDGLNHLLPMDSFRIHIETAWSKNRTSAAVDFDDLIHHFRIYYQNCIFECRWIAHLPCP